MAIELIFTKYTQEGCAAIVDGGYVARRAALDKIVTDVGGRLVGYWATDDGEWDSVMIIEGDGAPAGSATANLRGRASGQVERMRRYRLYNPDETDATLDLLAGVTWPGATGPSS
jgi:uncharacterized protein with GYD domain